MKLYYSPGACSLSPHIVARELNMPIELVRVDLASKTTPDGIDFNAINPKGYVPTLQLDDGRVLTEGPIIVQYLADLKPAAELVPAHGTFERYRVQEWLNFIGTEIHKTFSALFHPVADAQKEEAKQKLALRFGEIENSLADQNYLTGAPFTIADAYLYTVLRWTRPFHIDLAAWPKLQAYVKRVAARPAVQAAIDFEQAAKKAR